MQVCRRALLATSRGYLSAKPSRSSRVQTATLISTKLVSRSFSSLRTRWGSMQRVSVSGATVKSSLVTHQRRGLFVQTEKTPNPDSLKFIPGIPVLESGTADFATAMAAVSSPLAKRLFRNEGVKRVFLTQDFITITKEEKVDWDELKPAVFADIMEFFTSGEKAVSDKPPPSDTAIQPGDSETVQMIKELIETRIRPSVQDDGGDITYLGFVDGVVFVQMQGSCSGCPSSSVTLKGGIERMLQHWIPEVMNVMAVESPEEFEKLTSGGASADTAKASSETTASAESK
eukprot:TRINITY_DN150_c0_g1_i1.p1 TRINITY_DN150_c0_g1~~TRINITY_DN150_c0_g1_i1.p1  ORF type:complete len:288 (+),score=57.82 TRINITY_DN150_c0_g1_i1:337-1200(+)